MFSNQYNNVFCACRRDPGVHRALPPTSRSTGGTPGSTPSPKKRQLPAIPLEAQKASRDRGTSLCLCICQTISACVSDCLSLPVSLLSLPVSLPVYLSDCLPVCLCLCVCLSPCVSVRLPACLSLPVYLTVSLCLCLCVCLPVSLSKVVCTVQVKQTSHDSAGVHAAEHCSWLSFCTVQIRHSMLTCGTCVQ